MTVRTLIEIKNEKTPTIEPGATVQQAMDRLEKERISALVVSADGQSVDGIVSASDIVRGLNRIGAGVVDRTVADLMTIDVICCTAAEPMERVYELMNRHQIRYLPVLDHGSLCGLVSLLDVVRHRLDESEAEAEALKDYVSGKA
ncbi:MAG: CBS domain-containing protein [Alphaproteobacteria bacterium]|nr:CBS domain-containing protein [Alphaproteobacteria bacterium]